MSTDTRFNSLSRLATTFGLWWSRAAERRRLSDLDDHLLRDLGISGEWARLEGARPFWSGAEREVSRELNQLHFTALSEKDSGSRGCLSGRRNRPGALSGSIMGKSR
jgi:uncharacterized protein YjiS (DUF1127 family)